ncbi:MAG: NADH-quinone oxidoreductase subunit B family protein [Acidimicrobiales bacterium]
MSLPAMLRALWRSRATEPLARNEDATLGPSELVGSLQLRHVDAGSCNGCELELTSAFGPVYDAERFGARLVASPRHADGVLVTGPVTRNMAVPLAKTVDATPQPRVVIAVGDCACDCGVFRGGYGVVGAVGDVVPVDISIPGCPPHPTAIIEALRGITRR